MKTRGLQSHLVMSSQGSKFFGQSGDGGLRAREGDGVEKNGGERVLQGGQRSDKHLNVGKEAELKIHIETITIRSARGGTYDVVFFCGVVMDDK
jgi:hypothetical protein